MNGIDIEEIREALRTALDEAGAAESAIDDTKCEISDAMSEIGSAETAAYEAKERIEAAINLLDGWEEDQTEKVSPEDLRRFLINNLAIVDRAGESLAMVRGNIFQFAKDCGIDLYGYEVGGE